MCALEEDLIATHNILTAAFVFRTVKIINYIIICYQLYSNQILLVYHSYSNFSSILKQVLESCKHIHCKLGFVFTVTSKSNPSVLKFSLVYVRSQKYFIFDHVQNTDME